MKNDYIDTLVKSYWQSWKTFWNEANFSGDLLVGVWQNFRDLGH